jgi:dipeptidase E
MNLILSGGGDAPDSRPLDQLLISLIPADKKLLYIPIAWKSGDFDGCLSWFKSVFSKLDFNNYTMWVDLNNKTLADLNEIGGIYIGGGNTYKLLHDLQETGFDKLLLQFIDSGRPVFGGSAGAIIFGQTIDTAAFGDDADDNSVDLADTTGFKLLGNRAIQCHYRIGQDSEIMEYVLQKRTPIIALSERSGLYVTDNKTTTVVGFEPAYLFTDTGKSEYAVGSQLA